MGRSTTQPQVTARVVVDFKGIAKETDLGDFDMSRPKRNGAKSKRKVKDLYGTRGHDMDDAEISRSPDTHDSNDRQDLKCPRDKDS